MRKKRSSTSAWRGKGVRIVLFVPGNFFHANVPWEKGQRMKSELINTVMIFGNSAPKVRTTFAFQGIDYQLCPDLRKMTSYFKNLETIDAPHGHVLMSNISDYMKKWG